jgi:ribonucleoside-triphosphate reductase, adenosylcobalamin-dependent
MTKLTQHIGYTAPTANPLLFRTYCRMIEDSNGKLVRESAQQAIDRAIRGLDEFGLLTEEEVELIRQYFYQNIVFPSGRWFWIGGTDWIKQQKNYIGAYNCASVPVVDWEAFRFNFRALLMGCGVGTVVELDKIAQLPSIKYPITVGEVKLIGSNWIKGQARENSSYSTYELDEETLGVNYYVGDSKEGWVDVMTNILEFSSNYTRLPSNQHFKYKSITLNLDFSEVRAKGEPLEGFGGLSNPDLLEIGLRAVIQILNEAVGRQLDSLEVCLITDWAGAIAVSGNIRRSAKLQQGSPNDEKFVTSKDNLWVKTTEGWKIDSKRDVLRLSNHTLVYHSKPDRNTVIEAVRKQYYSGEGAIQWAGEAVKRCNVDILNTDYRQNEFLYKYSKSPKSAINYLKYLAKEDGIELDKRELEHRSQRYNANPCFEVVGEYFLCNLSQVHLNQLDPNNISQQREAFRASTLCALPLLSHEFDIEEFQYSREIDPIIGVSFTGLFDFFVNKFGAEWLEWLKTNRDKKYPLANYFLESEKLSLQLWGDTVKQTVKEYCSRHGIKQPNRYTVVQPSGSISLLTNASPGWHPPKATRYIRRITVAKDHSVAKACADYGYKVIPSQSCKDESGNLLDDINDSRVNEVLVEIPIEVSWANIADSVDFNPKDLTALTQLELCMMVQKHYATHTVSATIELSEHEIEPLGEEIYRLIQNDEGYISAALLAKFDSLETFPRLPFEPISKERYIQECQDVLSRRINDNFLELVNFHTTMMEFTSEAGSAGCDSDKCLLPEKR